MRRSTRMGLAAAGVAVAAACSETVYTYRPALVEAQALDEAALRLAAACEAREGSIVEDDVDLAGRRALFDLALHVARTRTDAGGQLDEVLRLFAELAAPLPLPAVAEGDVAPLDDLAAHAREIAARRAAELAPVLPESADGGTGSAIGDLAAGIRTRAQETTRDQVRRLLEGSFPEEAAACHAVRKASLRGEIVRHLPDEPRGPTFAQWKTHVLALHVSWIRCSERDVVAIFDEYEDRPRPGLVAWRFFAHPDSARVESRLDRALAP